MKTAVRDTSIAAYHGLPDNNWSILLLVAAGLLAPS